MTRAFVLLIFLLPASVFGQRDIPMPPYTVPGPDDAVLAGNKLPRTITCKDRIRVYLQGDRNEVQVQGDCGPVRIRGNGNFVWIEQETQIAVEGDNNVIYIRRSTTRVSSHGTGNRFELRR